MLKDVTGMRYLKLSDHRDIVEWWSPGASRWGKWGVAVQWAQTSSLGDEDSKDGWDDGCTTQ